MTLQQKSLLLLIKSAILEEEYNIPDEFNVEEAFSVAKKHATVPMLYYGALNCGVGAGSETMKKAPMAIMREIAVCEMQSAEIKHLCDAFDKAGIDYMPLKGTRMRALYPKPEMRRMGDADILIKEDQYEKICTVMTELSYAKGYVSDHEYAWDKPSVHIELHKRLIPSYNKDYYAYFGDGWRLGKVKSESGFCYSMTDEDEMIYLFTHFAKHYRDAGIGIRHLVDLWVYRINRPRLDEEYIARELEKLQLFEFYKNIVATLDVWFGQSEGNEKTEFITQELFSSGEFGKSEAGRAAAALRDIKGESSKSAVKLKRIRKAIFVDYSLMKGKYPVLNKAPFLLPVMWGVHFVKRLCKRKNNLAHIKNRLDVDTSAADTYKQSLNFVGLDFNFTT